jgi:hypothetical protein
MPPDNAYPRGRHIQFNVGECMGQGIINDHLTNKKTPHR